MNFILYPDVNDRSISQHLGRPECSDDVVLKAYRPLLESLGRVHEVVSFSEVDPLFRRFAAEGEESLCVSFAPPHKTPCDLSCPTVCVLAWEFDSIPAEHWDNDLRQDWSRTLVRHGRVITLSTHAAHAVRQALGEDFPVLVLPTPLWERFAEIREQFPSSPVNPGTVLQIQGCIIDSRILGLSADGLIAPIISEPEPEPEPIPEPPVVVEAPPLTLRRRLFIAKHYLRQCLREAAGQPLRRQLFVIRHYLHQTYGEGFRDLLPDSLRARLRGNRPPEAVAEPLAEEVIVVAPVEEGHPQAQLPATDGLVETQVDGVVYVSVFDPADERKNWHQLISAFCWAMRDVQDATLVLTMTRKDLSTYYVKMLTLLSQLSPFSCRVVVMHGDLDDQQHGQLYGAASFYVNASHCEDLCLPLMEFMACARPVIAPRHTAMLDYIDHSVAFIVASSQEPTAWPQDPRLLLRTASHRPDWGSLKNAYLASYQMAKQQPERYQTMSLAADERMRDYCNFAEVQQRLGDFLHGLPQARVAIAGTAAC